MRSAIACLLACALSVSAQVCFAAPAPAVAARIDGQPLLAFSVEAMARMAPARDAAGHQAILDQLIDNRLLAGVARERFGTARLSSGEQVGFKRDVMFDDQLIAALRAGYGAQMERDLRLLPAGIDGLLQREPRPDDATLDAVFGKPGLLLLNATLTAAQLERARRVVLLRFTLPGKSQRSVTLLDVYERQNVQGRIALFARDIEFMQTQARLLVAGQYVLDWSQHQFGAAAVADLRRALSDQADAQALLRLHGMGEDAHGDSSVLDQLASKVSAAQVDAYYQRNQAQFKRITRVRGRHIRVRDESSARAVAAALAAGANFSAMAQQHSIAPDAAQGGALGWVQHEGSPVWLAQLMFAQAEGQVSVPVRTPAGADVDAPWEIVLVEQREEGYQERRSESVRYVASRAIARELALAKVQALRRQLRQSARIEILPASRGSVS